MARKQGSTAQVLSSVLIHESNRIEGFNSEEADAALREAWTKLTQWLHNSVSYGQLNARKIAKVQEIVVSHQEDLPDIWRGRYRHQVASNRSTIGDVWVGGHKMPSPVKLSRLLDEWVQKYGDFEDQYDPIEAHIAFERIHPFMDGNGRTGRLLLWGYQKWNKLPFTEITYRDRWDYYDWFKTSEEPVDN